MGVKGMRYLTASDMDALALGYADIVGLLDKAFEQKGLGQAVLPPKHWLERDRDRFYSAMSSYLPAFGYAGCKWQSGDPANPARGLPYIQGLYILMEDASGTPVALMDSAWITGKRTAAASALAVKYLAKENPRSVAILGCGLQGRAHLESIVAIAPSLEVAQVFDVKRETAENYAEAMHRKTGVKVSVMPTARDAVRDTDIVVSAAAILKHPQPVIEPEWLAPGVLGISIDLDAYWTAAAVRAMTLIVTDDLSQVDHFRQFGHFATVPRFDAELDDLVLRRKPGRRSSQDRILTFNLGIGIEDLVTAIELYNRAQKLGVGATLAT